MKNKIDELLKQNPNLLRGVGILIQACKETSSGREAIDQWDKLRKDS